MPALFLSYDVDMDWFTAVEFGVVVDLRDPAGWEAVSEAFAFLKEPDGRCVGFAVDGFSAFEPEDPENAAIWEEPRFDVPVLGLDAARGGEVVLAARAFLRGRSTINRLYFDAAVGAKGEEAAALWTMCLQTGDLMAHYGLGYTLLELGRSHEAYRHLRAYARLAPDNPWAWCWLGRASAAIGERHEARSSYERALALEEDGGEETDAAELLDELG